jgi:hypothetical protein
MSRSRKRKKKKKKKLIDKEKIMPVLAKMIFAFGGPNIKPDDDDEISDYVYSKILSPCIQRIKEFPTFERIMDSLSRSVEQRDIHEEMKVFIHKKKTSSLKMYQKCLPGNNNKKI